MAKVNLPKNVKLGYRKFSIAKMNLEDGRFLNLIANIDFKVAEIKIREDLGGPEAAKSLLHEILHFQIASSAALCELFGEATIDELAQKLAELFEENPSVITWMVDKFQGM